jgi:hypothetical protein
MPPSPVRRAPSSARPSRRPAPPRARTAPAGGKAEHEILFQKYFKSVGPRTYAAQVKRANNGNHYLVFTEGKRDESTGEVRKTKLFVFSEDFVEFFRMLQDTAHFIKAHPVPDDVKQRRDKFWAKQNDQAGTKANPAAPARTPSPPGIARGAGVGDGAVVSKAPQRQSPPPRFRQSPRNGR